MTPFIKKTEYVVIQEETDEIIEHESAPVKGVVHEPEPTEEAIVHEPAPIEEFGHESAPVEEFPEFGHASHPVSRVPNWGNMYSSEEWERNYKQMDEADLVPVPRYNLRVLTKPMNELMQDREANIAAITAKLYYSTRFMGTYNLDAGEFSGKHPGIDLKLAEGTPVGSIGGGRVYSVNSDPNLGLNVIVEHQIPDEGTFYSIYGHLGYASVEKGDAVVSGTIIGFVGMTGKTTAPHVHLQVDRGAEGHYVRYWPKTVPSRDEVNLRTVNPITFVAQHR